MTNMSDRDRRQVARAFANWFLGDEWWADEIIDAYLEPDKALARIAREKARYV